MRALVFRNKVLTLEKNYPLPDLRSGEALIRVVMAGICNTDLEITRGYLAFEGVLGHEFVGIVEAVHEGPGASPPTYLIGKRVVGEINAACYRPDCEYCRQNLHTHCPDRTTLGIVNRDGAFADYLILPVANLHVVPDNVSDEEAVFVEPLAATFEMLEQVHIKPTDRVVVLGDGKMGQLAVQVLALSGCDVTMVGKHEEKLALAAARGIRTQRLEEFEGSQSITPGSRVDLVVECTGSAQGLELAMRLARPRGTIILKSTVADKSILDLAPIVIDEIRVQGSRCGPFSPALRVLSQRTVDVRPLISARYSLDEGLVAFEHAAQKGVLKVLVRV
ncbi:MAG TPA: alcohol dehydrogenase catalytic domain-containing protein [Ktedonobacteraceae bacterium]|nr:alcohol dehydrogenase catalytic domain-containing protein [Ktedonobacteraceae bacterium]